MAFPDHSIPYMSLNPNMMQDFNFSGFQPPPIPQDPSITCHKCMELYAVATSLRAAAAVLEAEVHKLQIEKRDAERVVKYVLRQNFDAANERTGPDAPNRYVAQLLQKVAKAKMEKDSIQSLLKHALQIISQLSTSNAGSTRSRSPTDKVTPNVDESLIDLGIGAFNNSPLHDDQLLLPLNSVNPLEHNDVGATDESSVEVARESEVVLNEYVSDSLSDTPYIFHFERASCPAGANSDDRILSTNPQKDPTDLVIASRDHSESRDFVAESPNVPILCESEGSLTAVESASSESTVVIKYDRANSSSHVIDPISLRSREIISNSANLTEYPVKAFNKAIRAASGDTTSSPARIQDTAGARDPTNPKFSKELFISSAERENAIQIHARNAGIEEWRFPDFFKYGIRFSPGSTRRDFYRTVVISNIPAKVHISFIMKHIRGGMILDVKLLDSASITGAKTALVTFLYHLAAAAFVNYHTAHPIVLYGNVTLTAMVKTPTWPVPIRLMKAIHEHKHTRCLEVHDFPGTISPSTFRRDLHTHYAMTLDFIESMSMRDDGVVLLNFTSIAHAGRAFGKIHSMRNYRTCAARFVADPCAKPLPSTGKIPFLDPRRLIPASEEVCDRESVATDESGRLSRIEWDNLSGSMPEEDSDGKP